MSNERQELEKTHRKLMPISFSGVIISMILITIYVLNQSLSEWFFVVGMVGMPIFTPMLAYATAIGMDLNGVESN